LTSFSLSKTFLVLLIIPLIAFSQGLILIFFKALLRTPDPWRLRSVLLFLSNTYSLQSTISEMRKSDLMSLQFRAFSVICDRHVFIPEPPMLSSFWSGQDPLWWLAEQ
jgi:hypothetical protein